MHVQAQTAECIVLGEIATDRIIVILSKIDLLPEARRSQLIAKAQKLVRATFQATRFAGCTILPASAKPGMLRTSDWQHQPPFPARAILSLLLWSSQLRDDLLVICSCRCASTLNDSTVNEHASFEYNIWYEWCSMKVLYALPQCCLHVSLILSACMRQTAYPQPMLFAFSCFVMCGMAQGVSWQVKDHLLAKVLGLRCSPQ